MKTFNDNNKNKSGIALIIILGLIAILLITTVTFTISMRIERAGAANLRHAALAKQLAKGALSYAITAIENVIPTNNPMPQWRDATNPQQLYWRCSGLTQSQRTPYDYPATNFWRDTIASYYKNSCAAGVLSSAVEKYLPPGLAYKGYASKLQTVDSSGSSRIVDICAPQWIPVKLPEGSNSVDSVVGRFAFVVFNTTGLIDINVATEPGEDPPRKFGQYPDEVKISHEIFKDEFATPQEITDMFNARNQLGEYSTFAELVEYGAIPQDLSSFDVFSHNPPRRTPNPQTDLVDISGNEASIRNSKERIEEAFFRSGLFATSYTCGEPYGEQAHSAYLGLLDYVDADSLPAGTTPEERFCRPVSEKMPLFAGAEALITVTRQECARNVLDQAGNVVGREIDPTKHKYEFRVLGKAAFTFDYEGQEEFDLKAHMAVEKDAGCPATFAPLIPSFQSTSGNESRVCDGYVMMPNIANFAPGAVIKSEAEINTVNGEPPPLDFRFKLYFAADIKKGNDRVRCVPFNENKLQDSNAADAWLPVMVDANLHNIDFAPNVVTAVADPGALPGTTPLSLQRWVAHKIVWTEVLDPGFACHEFYETPGLDLCTSYGFARPSVWVDGEDGVQVARGGTLIECPTENLRANFPAEFGNFSLPSSLTFPRNNDGVADADKRAENDLVRFFNTDTYFYLSGGGNYTHFTSPLVTYILSHPNVIGGNGSGSFGIHADGLQYRGVDSTIDDPELQLRRYVKNRPVESVGELGYLSIGPFTTIRLYNHQEDAMANSLNSPQFYPISWFSGIPGCDDWTAATIENYGTVGRNGKQLIGGTSNDRVYPDALGYHTVLDYFTTAPNVNRGLINVNTTSKSVLASAFYDMPIYTERSNFATPAVNADRAFDMADLLCETTASGGLSRLSQLSEIFSIPGEVEQKTGLAICNYSNQQISRVEEAAKAVQILYAASRPSENTTLGDFLISETDNNLKTAMNSNPIGEFERESLIRNSCGLFADRGQSFIIVIRAESFSSFFGSVDVKKGTVNAAKTAVAQIWRDTVPNNDGVYPIFVKYFKIIDD